MITVNGQSVPPHVSASQILAMFPQGVLGLRDPMGRTVFPNQDGSLDFNIIGDYYLPRHGQDFPMFQDPMADPRRSYSPNNTMVSPKRSASGGTSTARQYHVRPASQDGIGSAVLLTPAFPGNEPSPRSQRNRPSWNHDTHVEYNDPPLIFDKQNKAMGMGPGRYNARHRYRYRPDPAKVAPTELTRKPEIPHVFPRRKSPSSSSRRSQTPPAGYYQHKFSGSGSRSPSRRGPSPLREAPPMDISRYMKLKYGYNALTESVLKHFPGHNNPSDRAMKDSRVGMDLYSQPPKPSQKMSQLDDGPPSRLTAFILAEKNSVPTGRGLWRTLPKDVNLMSYSVP
eukprot:PhF_6_TR27311/c0_g1_i2/m.40107